MGGQREERKRRPTSTGNKTKPLESAGFAQKPEAQGAKAKRPTSNTKRYEAESREREKQSRLQRWWSINFLSGPADGLSVEESSTVGLLWVQRVERARSPPQRGAPGHAVASRAGRLLLHEANPGPDAYLRLRSARPGRVTAPSSSGCVGGQCVPLEA